MSLIKKIAIAAAALSALTTAATADTAGPTYKFYEYTDAYTPWVVTGEQTDDLSTCSMSTFFSDGTKVHINWEVDPEDGIHYKTMNIVSPSLIKLNGDKYEINATFVGRRIGVRHMSGYGEHMKFTDRFYVPELSADFISLFRHSREMTLRFASKKLHINLRGTERLLNAVRACVARADGIN